MALQEVPNASECSTNRPFKCQIPSFENQRPVTSTESELFRPSLRAREHFSGVYLEPGHDAYSDGDIDLQDFCNWANKAGFIGVPDDGLKLATAFGLPREAYLSESQQALRLKIQAATSPASEPQVAPVVAVAASGGVVHESIEQRRTRYLAMFEAEEKRGKRGALQRVATREGVDRSNMSKDIEKARTARDEQKRSGAWTSQLVKDGKRKR